MPQAKADLDQIFEYFAHSSVINSAGRIAEITAHLRVLAQAPLLGKPLAKNRRELLIGKRRNIYAVEYQYDQPKDTVFVSAIRSRRQAAR